MILITMAGLSSRFLKAGYEEPKYKLLISEESVFSHAVKSFEHYFSSEKFVFVVRDVYNTPEFVDNECKKLKIKDFDIVVLKHETAGQAETAYLALNQYKEDFQVLIFNIDTFRHNYKKPIFIDECDGYLEVFKGEGDHWSFIVSGENFAVLKTTEKERVSDYCSDGLYYFKSKNEFQSLFSNAKKNENTTRGEYYIAPLYNDLIKTGKNIKYSLIDQSEIDFCGTPEEYQLILDKLSLKNE